MYKRKTVDRWGIIVNCGHGWLYECSEYTYARAQQRLEEYQKNIKGEVRLVKHRERRSEDQADGKNGQNRDSMENIMKIGDRVDYVTTSIQSQFGGSIGGKRKSGIVEEIFPSMDGSFDCIWIYGEDELITERQVIQVIKQ